MLAMLTWRELNWSSNYCCEKGNYLKGRYIQDNKKKAIIFRCITQDWHPQNMSFTSMSMFISTLPEIQRKHLI